MIDNANGSRQPPTALSRLPIEVQVEIEGMSKPALVEALAGHVAAQLAMRLQLAEGHAALARLALAHLLARAHRGLVDAQGHAVDLATTIPLTGDAARLLPAEYPTVNVVPLAPDGTPWKGPQSGVPCAAIDVRVEAPVQATAAPTLLGAERKGDA